MGNVVNRVFDSSGPEGKVRGTPQQIIDKYNQLARDAQLAGDRVAAENFQQHAEHYLRLLGVALKEQEVRREEQERHNRERQAERDRERAKRQEREANGGDMVEDGSGDMVIDTSGDGDSNLVDTPESTMDEPMPEKTRRARKPRRPRSEDDGASGAPEAGGDSDPQAAAE